MKQFLLGALATFLWQHRIFDIRLWLRSAAIFRHPRLKRI